MRLTGRATASLFVDAISPSAQGRVMGVPSARRVIAVPWRGDTEQLSESATALVRTVSEFRLPAA